jgi:alpha-D-ribose 1-methylphosphonate 5-triphosphate synthase subunit PhnG
VHKGTLILEAVRHTERQAWISTLAKADAAQLLEEWNRVRVDERPTYDVLRQPEIGLVMVRGRAGGVGDRFNLGEMTVTRCAVRLASGVTGISYRSGRDRLAAEVAAILDGMLQQPESHGTAKAIVDRIDHTLAARRAEQARRSGATKVQFFTMTRTREDVK